MVEELAIKSAEALGRTMSQVNNLFRIFLALFALSVGLDYEFNVITIKGEGEVLGQSSALVGDVLQKMHEVAVPIKLLDLAAIVLGILMVIDRKNIANQLRPVYKSILCRFFLAGGLFLIWAGISMLVNAHDFSKSQLLIMELHWLKLLQVICMSIVAALFAREFDISKLSSTLLLGFLFASAVLFLNKMAWINFGVIVGDRMESFGCITISILLFIHLYTVESRKVKISPPKNFLYILTVFISSVAILISQKRGIELSFIAVCIGLFLVKLKFKKERSSLLVVLLIALIISMPSIFFDIKRTINQKYDAVRGTIFNKYIVEEYINLIESKVSVIEFLDEGQSVPLVSSLDYSGAERVGKIIRVIRLSAENLWVGSGFWGAQYKYGFIPDSGLQIILETGLIGMGLILLIFYALWRGVIQGRSSMNELSISNSVGLSMLFISMSVFCNPFYMSRLVMMAVFFVFLVEPWMKESVIPE